LSSCVLALWPRMPPARAECGVSQIVKTAQYRGRLSAPCLYGDFYSPRARPRGAQECCGKAYSSFSCHFIVRYTQVIMLTSSDVSGGDGRMHGRARQCKAKQGRHGKTALTYESYLYISTDFGPRTRGGRDLFVTLIWKLFLLSRMSRASSDNFAGASGTWASGNALVIYVCR
jgi:hypothetical protein